MEETCRDCGFDCPEFVAWRQERSAQEVTKD